MARMSWHEACQLDHSLVSLNHFFTPAPDYAQTLAGGLTNRCWRVVTLSGDSYVWRPTTAITQAFSLSRFQEYQILSAIEDCHIAPKAIHINPQGLLVEWLEGESMTESVSFDSILKVLCDIHNLETGSIPVAPFNYTARIDHYWMRLKDQFKSEEYAQLYHQWRSAPALADIGQALCHFDLAGYNMVRQDDGPKVIDWEYSAIGDPRLDLTLSIASSGEPLLESVYRYCQLRSVEGVDDWVEGVMAWQPRVTMMTMLWYLLAYQLWGEEDYLIQAEKLRDTFCR
ncbi:phosphotransferase [Vibrio ostreicida]|uniref:Phosphotransferase n=1 Tax=Vibrio ostreicida TaxID=526588 RepID=A0ABT8BW47_9VIBR|nr:phosphotransferase [Vibrio ostreicida]MDN3610355.1 phosphotransferase [Vibrio ostreicida]NPD07633.1 phosphotransferase [Vibrio ostreicida]